MCGKFCVTTRSTDRPKQRSIFHWIKYSFFSLPVIRSPSLHSRSLSISLSRSAHLTPAWYSIYIHMCESCSIALLNSQHIIKLRSKWYRHTTHSERKSPGERIRKQNEEKLDENKVQTPVIEYSDFSPPRPYTHN